MGSNRFAFAVGKAELPSPFGRRGGKGSSNAHCGLRGLTSITPATPLPFPPSLQMVYLPLHLAVLGRCCGIDSLTWQETPKKTSWMSYGVELDLCLC